MTGRRAGVLAGGLAAALALSGCGLGRGLYNAPLPGGADLGGHPYTVTAQFLDARDLVPQAGVKVNDVAVGRVSSIGLDKSGRVAEVRVELNGSVRLPANAVAAIQQTSLLGEKYVALSAPLGVPATGRLRNGDTITKSRTTNGVEVEQVFGALSLLLNGGGIGQLNDITRELNQFAGGHEAEIRTFLASADRVVRDLNARKSSITRALDALATLSTSLRSQNGNIRRVLDSLAPGLDVIAEQRDQLVGALSALDRLSTVTVRTLQASKDDIVSDLKTLAPILRHLADAGSALPRSLQVLLTYPFTDGATAGIVGDYLNGYATVSLRTPGGTVYRPTAARLPASGPQVVATPAGLLPATSSAAAGLPSTLTLTPVPSGSASASASGSGSGSPVGFGVVRNRLVRRVGTVVGIEFRRGVAVGQFGRLVRRFPVPDQDEAVEVDQPVREGRWLMLTRTTRLQVLAFIVIAVVGVAYVGVRYVGAGRWFGAAGYTIEVDLPSAGGIFTAAEVTYRGVTVGRVGDVRLTRTGVRVDADITSDRRIPRDVEAVVANRSVIGEQYLDLRPRHDRGPYLADGSVVRRSDTELPPPVEDLLLSTDRFARSVPIGSLRTVVNELYLTTHDAGQDLQSLIDTNRSFFTTADQTLPQTVDLIDSSQTVLATQQRDSRSITDFSANLALIGAQLRTSDGDIRRVLDRAQPALAETNGLIDGIQGSANVLLTNLLTTSQVFLADSKGLREVLVKLPVAVTAGGALVTPNGINVGLVPTFFDPLPCTSGYGGTKVRSGLDTSGNPALNLKAACTAPLGSGTDIRGSQHAPGHK